MILYINGYNMLQSFTDLHEQVVDSAKWFIKCPIGIIAFT